MLSLQSITMQDFSKRISSYKQKPSSKEAEQNGTVKVLPHPQQSVKFPLKNSTLQVTHFPIFGGGKGEKKNHLIL